jgi:hypothetical protein
LDYEPATHALRLSGACFYPRVAGSSPDGLGLRLRRHNPFNEAPDFTSAAVNSNGDLAFPNYSPPGSNRRFLRARVGLGR